LVFGLGCLFFVGLGCLFLFVSRERLVLLGLFVGLGPVAAPLLGRLLVVLAPVARSPPAQPTDRPTHTFGRFSHIAHSPSTGFGRRPDPAHEAVGERLHLSCRDRDGSSLPRLQQPTTDLVSEPGQLRRLAQELCTLLKELPGSTCPPPRRHTAQHESELHLLGPPQEISACDSQGYPRSALHWISFDRSPCNPVSSISRYAGYSSAVPCLHADDPPAHVLLGVVHHASAINGDDQCAPHSFVSCSVASFPHALT
jgi:hypothetical protein